MICVVVNKGNIKITHVHSQCVIVAVQTRSWRTHSEKHESCDSNAAAGFNTQAADTVIYIQEEEEIQEEGEEEAGEDE